MTRDALPSASLTGIEAVGAVATGALTVSDVVSRSLERVRDLDGRIGAFRVIDEGAVMARGKELDEDAGGGRARGLVVGVKDVIDTADLPTGYGSPLFADYQPTTDADVVRRLREQGAVVLGKTETTEFAMFQPTRTRNPVDPNRTPGGSSSGSAAAVALNMVPVALGTQTAGSVVRPAAYCGVYGFKPNRGWTSTNGIWALAERLDTVGLFARNVADLRLLYTLLADRAAPILNENFRAGGTALASPSSVRVAILSADEWGPADDDVRAALAGVGDRLAAAGCRVTEMAMPASWRHLPDQHSTVMAVEVARNLRRRLGERVEQISDNARSIVERGDQIRAAEYLAALDGAKEALRVLDSLRVVADLVLTPSALGVAPVGLDFTGDPVMCRPWTLLGLPAANVPAFRRPDGLPVGVQAVGLDTDDLQYLDTLAAVEAALDIQIHGEGEDPT
jgi:Asp-tRNA(Asn)/Glu-tRNA(Gln) amidotransferase A subunit family amidase